VETLREQIDRADNCVVTTPTVLPTSRFSLENRDRDIAELECEKAKLSHEVAELQEQLCASKLAEQALTGQLEILSEKVLCVEENFQTKKQDLAEKELALDTAHEKIVELKLEIVSLQQTPENAKKGNSLFAEVDDQRQKMRSILATQNQQYQEMKKKFDEKNIEIRRLKLENDAIEKQLMECQFIFTNADQCYKRK
jgi:chromosome segregation ATPase